MRTCAFPLILLLFVTGFPVLGQPSFSEVAVSRGIQHVSIASDFMGAAVAVFDYNNDGWQDIYLTGGLHPDKLFKNLGNGVFTDVTTTAGGFQASISYKTTSVVTADLDNDGDREVIVGTARNMPLFVYKNNGDGTFTHITPTTGIATTKNTQAIVTGDYDLDGKMDIYVINYVLVPRTLFDANGNVIGYNHTGTTNEMYRGLGSLTFTETGGLVGVCDTVYVGISPPGPFNAGCGLAGLFTDINGDYLPDIYVANDFGMFTHIHNAYFQNTYPIVGFEDRRVASHLNAAMFGMGIAHGDFDRDGKLDLYVTNLGRNILYRQTSPGVFQDVTTTAGVEDGVINALNIVGWGTAFFDYDNDGFEDLYVANGYVPAAKTYETYQNADNKLYHNLGNGTFEDVSVQQQVNDNKMHRGMAVGDFDNDGDEDMIVTKLVSTGVPADHFALYYLNTQQSGHHWLQVSLKGNGTTTNRDGFGSTVKIHYGNLHGVKALSGGSSHASQNTSVLHFGINTAASIDSVEVFWPGGQRTRVLSPGVNRHIIIEQGVAGYGILGCMNAAADNYDPTATQNYGCFTAVPGCTDVSARNYNPAANSNNGTCDLVSAIDKETLPVGAIYPNPMGSEFSIFTGKSERTTVELFDVQGRLVFQTETDGTSNTFAPDLRPGLYYYRLTSFGQIIHAGKIIRK